VRARGYFSKPKGGPRAEKFGEQWPTPWQRSFEEDKNLLTLPGVENGLLSCAPLATVTTTNKVLVHKAL